MEWQLTRNDEHKKYGDNREVNIGSFHCADGSKLLSHPYDQGMEQMCYNVKCKFAQGKIPKRMPEILRINQLIPTQETLIIGHLQYLQECWEQLGPVLVVEYKQRFCLADGHHRVCLAAYAKQTVIPAYVIHVLIENHRLVYNGLRGIE